MKKLVFPIIFALLCLQACDESQDERSTSNLLNTMENDYLQQVEKLGISDLYKEVKWRLYCNHCDVAVKDCAGTQVPGLTYGMLDLKVFFLKYENGKGELAYTFIYNDSLQCSLDNVQGNKVHGFGFEKDGLEPLYYIALGSTNQISINCDTMKNIEDCPTRMMNPDQPVVKKYLLTNREKLNPWFHMEAMKRGFITD